MSAFDEYLGAVRQQLEQTAERQRLAIETAAGWLSDALVAGRFLYVFGTGHSHLLAEEVFYRAGGLARVIPILDEPLMLHQAASESTQVERRLGYAADLLKRYPVGPGDVLLVASNSGRNAVPIELTLEARARGARTIALTSLTQSAAWPSRHPSGKKLADVAELVLDNGVRDGDAVVAIPGLDQRVGPTSSVMGLLLINLVVVSAVENATARGYPPEVFVSSNAGGDDHNERLIARFRPVNPHL
ncbi:MAG: SIS domain-containing protein [Verrucomicrobia bacterium]|nr:SIS domain-containing protein [Verrucomicrobiota bacterium]